MFCPIYRSIKRLFDAHMTSLFTGYFFLNSDLLVQFVHFREP
jgi:hypothetical protein